VFTLLVWAWYNVIIHMPAAHLWMALPFLASLLLLQARNERLQLLGRELSWQGAVMLALALFITHHRRFPLFTAHEAQFAFMPPVAVHLALVAGPALLLLLAQRRRIIRPAEMLTGLLIIAWLALGEFMSLAVPGLGEASRLAYQWLAAFVTLIAALWLAHLGRRLRQRGVEWAGLGLFIVEVLNLYVVTMGGLLNTSLFLLLGGVLFIVLAWTMLKISARKPRESAQ